MVLCKGCVLEVFFFVLECILGVYLLFVFFLDKLRFLFERFDLQLSVERGYEDLDGREYELDLLKLSS